MIKLLQQADLSIMLFNNMEKLNIETHTIKSVKLLKL